MNYEIMHQPAYALAHINLDSQEEIQAEAGAMVSMSDTIELTTGIRGGLFLGLKRRMVGGEGFFINTFRAKNQGELTLAPPMPGDIAAIELDGNAVMVQSGSFLAATKEIEVDTKWGGAKTFFSKEGLWLLKCSGWGLLLVSSYGAVHRVDLEPGEKYTVDTGHMVAFDEGLRYSVGTTGSVMSNIFGGEGLVCKLEGPGRFFLQTRSEDNFIAWLRPKLSGLKR